MLQHKLAGVGAAMITPFTPDGRVDYQALARMLDYITARGLDELAELCTTHASSTLYYLALSIGCSQSSRPTPRTS